MSHDYNAVYNYADMCINFLIIFFMRLELMTLCMMLTTGAVHEQPYIIRCLNVNVGLVDFMMALKDTINPLS